MDTSARRLVPAVALLVAAVSLSACAPALSRFKRQEIGVTVGGSSEMFSLPPCDAYGCDYVESADALAFEAKYNRSVWRPPDKNFKLLPGVSLLAVPTVNRMPGIGRYPSAYSVFSVVPGLTFRFDTRFMLEFSGGVGACRIGDRAGEAGVLTAAPYWTLAGRIGGAVGFDVSPSFSIYAGGAGLLLAHHPLTNRPVSAFDASIATTFVGGRFNF